LVQSSVSGCDIIRTAVGRVLTGPCCTPAQEQLKTDPPYSPLSPLEVEALGAPPPQEPDAYLRARIDRFYAELQVFT